MENIVFLALQCEACSSDMYMCNTCMYMYTYRITFIISDYIIYVGVMAQTCLSKTYHRIYSRAGASGPAGPVLAGPILSEKVGVFISRLHVGVAARSIVTQRCTKCKQLQRNAWGTVILGQTDVPAVWNLR